MQSLRCAWLIDQGQTEEAKDLLEEFIETEFEEKLHEKDIEMVVHSLYGLIDGESEQGRKSIQKAQGLVKELGSQYEQRQWIRLPRFLKFS